MIGAWRATIVPAWRATIVPAWRESTDIRGEAVTMEG